MSLSCRQAGKVMLFAVLSLAAVSAQAWIRSPANTFATLPADSANPEALTVGPDGRVYASTFAGGQIHVFAPNGRHLRTVDVNMGSGSLLNLAFHPDTGALLVIDFGARQLLEVDPHSGAANIVASFPAGTGPNDLTFDADGNIYVSDSFQGKIWRIPPGGGTPQEWAADPLLATTGFPGFGANGLAFNHDQSALFVANTGDDTIVRIPRNADGSAGQAEVFVNSPNGPDGLIMDDEDNLWIPTNQENEILVVDSTGKAIATLGDFDGINRDGTVNGLLFPSDLAFSANGRSLYVANFALDVRNLGATQSFSSQWTDQVQRFSLARIRAKLPPLPAAGRPCADNDDDHHGCGHRRQDHHD